MQEFALIEVVVTGFVAEPGFEHINDDGNAPAETAETTDKAIGTIHNRLNAALEYEFMKPINPSPTLSGFFPIALFLGLARFLFSLKDLKLVLSVFSSMRSHGRVVKRILNL